jgi:DUF1009 family protein
MPGRLGILAGGGALPRRLVEAGRAQGRDVFVLAFDGHTDPATTEGVEHAWVRLGAAGTAVERLRGAGVVDLVMAGPVRRPSLAELRPDFYAARFLARIGARMFGDDGLLGAVVGLLESEGFRVLGIEQVLKGLEVPEGPLGRHAPDMQAEQDIARAIAVVRALGGLDIGQAAIVQQGVVLAVEGAEGTDRLVARSAELRREGPRPVLVKMVKPGQERRVDRPAIGVETVRAAVAAGLAGIAVEAGGAIVVDRDALIALADAGGIFVVGVAPPVA